jgi:DNA replication protein DnaC
MTELTTVPPSTTERIRELLTLFKLPTLSNQLVRRFCEAGYDEALGTMLELLEGERDARSQHRCDRLLRASQLPPGKTFETLDQSRLPRKVVQQLRELSSGAFLDSADNVLCFGLPGRGKTHAAIAFRLVQELLAAKRDLVLPKALRKLDNFELIILDDIGYVQQSADEVEVLFTLMAERYERRSLLITSNLVFSEWDRIFKNPMTTLAAIDRLVHHSSILEFGGRSKREEDAEKRNQ